jgi:hypothetical protein
MKIIIILAILLSLSGKNYSQICLDDKLQKNLIGKWQLNSDKEYFIILTKDKMKSIYKGKVKSENLIEYRFSNLKKFYKGKSVFDFTNGLLINSDSKIIEYQKYESSIDTVINTIVYVDTNNLEINADGHRVSFKKIR